MRSIVLIQMSFETWWWRIFYESLKAVNRIFQNFNFFCHLSNRLICQRAKVCHYSTLLVTKEIFFVKYDPKNTKLGAFLDIISKPSRNILSHQVPNPLFFTLYPLITYCLSKQSIIVHYIYKIAIKNSQISIYIKIYVSIMMQYFIMSWYCIRSQCSIILLPCITSWPSVALWPGIASWSNHILWPSIAPWLCITL